MEGTEMQTVSECSETELTRRKRRIIGTLAFVGVVMGVRALTHRHTRDPRIGQRFVQGVRGVLIIAAVSHPPSTAQPENPSVEPTNRTLSVIEPPN